MLTLAPWNIMPLLLPALMLARIDGIDRDDRAHRLSHFSGRKIDQRLLHLFGCHVKRDAQRADHGNTYRRKDGGYPQAQIKLGEAHA